MCLPLKKKRLTTPVFFALITGYFGAAGMISVELVEQGVAWVDELALSIVDNRASEL